MLKAIELRRFPKHSTTFKKWGTVYPVVAGVYFDESVRPDVGNDLLNQEPYHCEIAAWLEKNTRGSYHRNHIVSSYVLFEDFEEATLCRMAFGG